MYNKYVRAEHEYIVEWGVNSKIKEGQNFGLILEKLYELYGEVRVLEYNRGTQEHAKVITIETFDKFIDSDVAKKHVTKVKSMKTTGHIENYINKNVTIHLVNYLRSIYDIKDKIKEEYSEEFTYWKNNNEFDTVTNEILEQQRNERSAKIERSAEDWKNIKY